MLKNPIPCLTTLIMYLIANTSLYASSWMGDPILPVDDNYLLIADDYSLLKPDDEPSIYNELHSIPFDAFYIDDESTLEEILYKVEQLQDWYNKIYSFKLHLPEIDQSEIFLKLENMLNEVYQQKLMLQEEQ